MRDGSKRSQFNPERGGGMLKKLIAIATAALILLMIPGVAAAGYPGRQATADFFSTLAGFSQNRAYQALPGYTGYPYGGGAYYGNYPYSGYGYNYGYRSTCTTVVTCTTVTTCICYRQPLASGAGLYNRMPLEYYYGWNTAYSPYYSGMLSPIYNYSYDARTTNKYVNQYYQPYTAAIQQNSDIYGGSYSMTTPTTYGGGYGIDDVFYGGGFTMNEASSTYAGGYAVDNSVYGGGFDMSDSAFGGGFIFSE